LIQGDLPAHSRGVNERPTVGDSLRQPLRRRALHRIKLARVFRWDEH